MAVKSEVVMWARERAEYSLSEAAEQFLSPSTMLAVMRQRERLEAEPSVFDEGHLMHGRILRSAVDR